MRGTVLLASARSILDLAVNCPSTAMIGHIGHADRPTVLVLVEDRRHEPRRIDDQAGIPHPPELPTPPVLSIASVIATGTAAYLRPLPPVEPGVRDRMEVSGDPIATASDSHLHRCRCGEQRSACQPEPQRTVVRAARNAIDEVVNSQPDAAGRPFTGLRTSPLPPAVFPPRIPLLAGAIDQGDRQYIRLHRKNRSRGRSHSQPGNCRSASQDTAHASESIRPLSRSTTLCHLHP